MDRDTWRRVAYGALWPVGLVAAAGLVALGMTDERVTGVRLDIALAAITGLAYTASGLIAARRRPRNRLGALMVALGLLWLAGWLAEFSRSPAVFTAAIFINDAWVVPFAYFLVSFPIGRARSRAARLPVAAFAIAVIPLEVVFLLFTDPGAPGNALQVWDDPGAADAIDWVQRVILTGAALALTALLAKRWRTASAPLRRRLTPILVGAVAVLVADGNVLVDKISGHSAPHALQDRRRVRAGRGAGGGAGRPVARPARPLRRRRPGRRAAPRSGARRGARRHGAGARGSVAPGGVLVAGSRRLRRCRRPPGRPRRRSRAGDHDGRPQRGARRVRARRRPPACACACARRRRSRPALRLSSDLPLPITIDSSQQ